MSQAQQSSDADYPITIEATRGRVVVRAGGQLLADTTGRPVHVPSWREIPARGAALFGAVAAGVYEDIGAAIQATRPSSSRTYTPEPAATEVYDGVYAIYRTLYDTLGRSQVNLLHDLKRIRSRTREG